MAAPKEYTHVWFAWHAGADRHFRDRSDYFWAPKASRTGQVPGQEHRGIQARVERAEEHARRRNPDGRTEDEAGRSRAGRHQSRPVAADQHASSLRRAARIRP